MKNYYITKTENGYRFFIQPKETKGKNKPKKKLQEEIGLELLYSEKYREK
ncbi:MAG TPA: hypothetical protein VIK96_04750 [Bacilli bacterium]